MGDKRSNATCSIVSLLVNWKCDAISPCHPAKCFDNFAFFSILFSFCFLLQMNCYSEWWRETSLKKILEAVLEKTNPFWKVLPPKIPTQSGRHANAGAFPFHIQFQTLYIYSTFMYIHHDYCNFISLLLEHAFIKALGFPGSC